MYKKGISLILALAVVVMFSGCGNKKKSNELVMWLVGSEAKAQAIMEFSKEFTEKTGVTVLCEAISWGNAHSKYLTSIAGGVSPDIGTMGLTWGMEFGALGAMMELNSEYADDIKKLDEKNFKGLVDDL